MPRLFIRRKEPLSTDTRIERARDYNVYRADEWIDPFPLVVGTRPEKMVYAELVRRRVPFVFQSYYRFSIPEFGFDKWYRPDFVIPATKTIIEIQGAYWHSTEKQIEKDAFRFAVFEELGYKVVAWWDFEIESNLQELILGEPGVASQFGKGERIFTGDEKVIDDSAGIVRANQSRTDYGARQPVYASSRKSPGGLFSYDTR